MDTLAKKIKKLAGFRRPFHNDLEWNQFVNSIIRGCLHPRNQQINWLKRRIKELEKDIEVLKKEKEEQCISKQNP